METRNDSMLVQQSMVNAARSFAGNSAMGFGGDRDPAIFSYIQAAGDLGDVAASVLYEASHLIQKIVYLYPLEAADHWLKFSAKSEGNGDGDEIDVKLQEYLNSRSDTYSDTLSELSQGSLSDLFFEASFNARLTGRAYILLGVEDGREWFEPIDAANIKSLRRMEVLFKWEVTPHRTGNQRYTKPQYYRLNRGYRSGNYEDESKEPPMNGLIHHSRILRFDGLLLPERSLMRRSGQGKSVIDSVWRALVRAENSFNAAGYLLQTSSMFTYGLKGLAEVRDKQVRDALISRFETIMMSMSVLKGIPYDPDAEQVGTLDKKFSGVDSMLQIILDQVAIECDVPRSKVFEMSEAGGLNSVGKGESERFMWSQVLDAWRTRNWVKPFLYLGKLASLAKDYQGPKKIDGLGVIVPDSLQLSPAEKLEMQEQHMGTMDTAIAAGILTPWEARQSTYGGQTWNYEITLDDRVSKRMEQEAIAPPLPMANPTQPNPPNPDQPTDPQLEQFDRADDATRAQKKLQWNGFTIGLQYRTGDLRHGRLMQTNYGYIEKTRGADGMACDVYVGPWLDSKLVFEVEQVIEGRFDEHKYVIGVKTIEEAKAIYCSAMPPEFMGEVKEVGLIRLEAQRIN